MQNSTDTRLCGYDDCHLAVIFVRYRNLQCNLSHGGYRLRYRLLAAAAVLSLSTMAFSQTIYPIDRATILSSANFDFKVEFPKIVKRENVRILVNGRDFEEVFGKKATFIENEGRTNASSLILKDVSIGARTRLKRRLEVLPSPVTWDIFGTPDKPKAKNVIFFVADGFSVAHRTGARLMSKGNVEGKATGRPSQSG